jgi:hypothetical protein
VSVATLLLTRAFTLAKNPRAPVLMWHQDRG